MFEAIKEAASGIRKISEVPSIGEKMCGCEHITKASVDRIDLGKGQASITTVSYTHLSDEAFLSQFAGKTAGDLSIDVVAGATFTSEGILSGCQKAAELFSSLQSEILG